MSYDDTDGSIVERIVGLCVEEWVLEYSGGEAYLVCCRVVVCVDSLWSHVPLVTVDRFAYSLLVLLSHTHAACLTEILIE